LHLKARLTKQPVLTHPDFKIPFLVDTDASGDGLGAVLSQDIAGKERVIAYASRTLSKTERKYCATRREMLALVWALKQFRCFLYGRKFTVRTDHGSLTWLRNFKEPEGQVARWLQQLGEFDFE
ncbi:Retrovirus-related Pol polyprotein from transposon, partial [Trichinella britovi]